MKEGRGFASLSSSLLARKGQARPAMRPSRAQNIEDLGWNDMGHDDHQADDATSVPAPIRYQAAINERLNASPTPEMADLAKESELAPFSEGRPARAVMQPVVKERPSKTVRQAVPIKSRVKQASVKANAKAAFTLRLDPDRHLRLRLVCAISNQSAQMIVTQALDALLETKPEIDQLADQVPLGVAKH